MNPDAPVRNRLAAEIANGLCQFAGNWETFFTDYRARSLTIGRRVQCTVGNDTFPATAVGIDPLGGLMVKLDDGTERTLYSGEAKLLPLPGREASV